MRRASVPFEFKHVVNKQFRNMFSLKLNLLIKYVFVVYEVEEGGSGQHVSGDWK